MSGVFFTVVCPLLGTLICNGMWLAPLPAVRDMHEKQDMGELNPLPWVAGLSDLEMHWWELSNLYHCDCVLISVPQLYRLHYVRDSAEGLLHLLFQHHWSVFGGILRTRIHNGDGKVGE
jgi:hypothetical protein